MTAGPCESLAKIELISHDGPTARTSGTSANPCLHPLHRNVTHQPDHELGGPRRSLCSTTGLDPLVLWLLGGTHPLMILKSARSTGTGIVVVGLLRQVSGYRFSAY